MLPLFIFILSYMYITNSYDKSIKYCTFIESILVSFSTIEIYFLNKNIYICFLFIFYCITSFLVSNLLAQNLLLRNRYYETSSQFEKEETSMKAMYNSMISSQDEKIENAILSERNRISRDIHDSLGHLTSRGILQIGAMIVTEKNESRKKQLMDLKDTLSDGMNEVRKSLHNFQNESIDLHNELENIVDSFDFCKLDFTYSITSELSLKEKYSIIYIIKESLTNIAKHSNAKYASINIMEMNNRIYIKVYDNGNCIDENSNGMGIFSIKKRVSELSGNIDISTAKGFLIFISFEP